MACKLYHTDSRFRADPRTILLPPHPIAEIESDDPEDVYALTQHVGARPWWVHPAVQLLIRSTSVGDVIQAADGTRLVIAPIGMEPFAPPTADMTPVQQLIWARQRLLDLRPQLPGGSRADMLLQEALVLLTDALDGLLSPA